jgi:HK97 family phage major capsid protein
MTNSELAKLKLAEAERQFKLGNDQKGYDLMDESSGILRKRDIERKILEFGPQEGLFVSSETRSSTSSKHPLGTLARAVAKGDIRAATGASEGVSSDGGFLLKQDHSDDFYRLVLSGSPVLDRVRKVQISGNANSIKFNAFDETDRADGSRFGGVRGYWVAEAGSITKSKPKFRQITLNLNKLASLFYATDELLADASVLGSLMEQALAEELGFMAQDSIINGSGAGQCLGIMNSPALITVSKETGQAADTVVAENIMKMWMRLPARSRKNAIWVCNQDIEVQLSSMSLAVGTGGVPVFMPAGGLSQSGYSMLFGRPLIPIEQCASLGDLGDVLLFDPDAYILGEKGGFTFAQSPHVQFSTDEMCFRMTYRVDGSPLQNAAVAPYKGAANTVSPYVTLEART